MGRETGLQQWERLGALEDGSPIEVQAPPSQAAVMEALARHQNNVSAAARALGLHRTQLRRMLARSNG